MLGKIGRFSFFFLFSEFVASDEVFALRFSVSNLIFRGCSSVWCQLVVVLLWLCEGDIFGTIMDTNEYIRIAQSASVKYNSIYIIYADICDCMMVQESRYCWIRVFVCV